MVGIEGGESHVVEDAEAVGHGAHAVELHPRVVPRRPYRAEGVVGLAVKHAVDRFEHRSYVGFVCTPGQALVSRGARRGVEGGLLV